MGCNDNFEPNEEECNGCINWKYGTCMYEERRRIRDKRIVGGEMMKYKYIFSALQCDKFISHFIRNADLGINDVGIKVVISFLSDKKLTDEEIEKTKKYLESSEQEKELKIYLTSIKLERVELLEEE